MRAPAPLLLRGGRVTPLDTSRPAPPLGLSELAGSSGVEVETFAFEEGDIALLYTDGVIEARDGSGPSIRSPSGWPRGRPAIPTLSCADCARTSSPTRAGGWATMRRWSPSSATPRPRGTGSRRGRSSAFDSHVEVRARDDFDLGAPGLDRRSRGARLCRSPRPHGARLTVAGGRAATPTGPSPATTCSNSASAHPLRCEITPAQETFGCGEMDHTLAVVGRRPVDIAR
ncbi:SpoIIE family protein phosphatase [Kitasatospora aburaviensis]